jgi:protein-L-isoaspartate(D-aspartate) O-methyltransferase
MLPPKLEARMLQALAVKPTDRVLEIGTGSGYMTGLLAHRAAHVYSVEIVPEFSAQAAARLAAHDIRNVTLEVGDGARGWGREQYDAIVLTGSTPMLPQRFLEQLQPGGRVFAIVGDAPVMTARLTRWTAPGAPVTIDLFETVVAPLDNAAAPGRFRF